MAFNDNAEHVRILSSVRKGIDGLRRRMQELQPQLSTSASDRKCCASRIVHLIDS